jgi:hypothetical protein
MDLSKVPHTSEHSMTTHTYSHGFRGWVTLNEAFIETVRAFIDYSGVIVESGDGEGQPSLLEEDEICLNGSSLLRQNNDPFLLVHGVNHRSYCVTQAKPYDVIVAATLLLATAHNKGFKVNSDGTWTEPLWVAARDLYHTVTGEEAICPEEMGGPGNWSRHGDGGVQHTKRV